MLRNEHYNLETRFTFQTGLEVKEVYDFQLNALRSVVSIDSLGKK